MPFGRCGSELDKKFKRHIFPLILQSLFLKKINFIAFAPSIFRALVKSSCLWSSYKNRIVNCCRGQGAPSVLGRVCVWPPSSAFLSFVREKDLIGELLLKNSGYQFFDLRIALLLQNIFLALQFLQVLLYSRSKIIVFLPSFFRSNFLRVILLVKKDTTSWLFSILSFLLQNEKAYNVHFLASWLQCTFLYCPVQRGSFSSWNEQIFFFSWTQS